MKIGDKVLFVADYNGPDTAITEMTITKIGKHTVQCGSAENTHYKAFLWPVEYREKLLEVLKKRAILKKASDELSNNLQ